MPLSTLKEYFLWHLVHVTVNLQISLQIKLDEIMCGLCHLWFKIAVTGPNRREFIHSYNQKYLQVSQTAKKLYKIVVRINLLSLECFYSKFKRALEWTFSSRLCPQHPFPRGKYCYWSLMYFPIRMLWKTLLVESSNPFCFLFLGIESPKFGKV